MHLFMYYTVRGTSLSARPGLIQPVFQPRFQTVYPRIMHLYRANLINMTESQ